MKQVLSLTLGLTVAVYAEAIPQSLWGKWTVKRILPTTTISCWGKKEATSLVGTELEYSRQLFRWNKTTTGNPEAEATTITASQFRDEHSGGGANSSQVTFKQLGIQEARALQVVIHHPDAHITGATIEIPGDRVLLKGPDILVFSVCNVYLEAIRQTRSDQR